MKRITLLLPLIAALTGMSYAVAEDKPMTGPGMTSAAAPQDMKDMKAKEGMMKPEGDMKAMHDKCMDGNKGMGDMKAMHDKCMKGMEGMKDMPGMKAAVPAKKTKQRKSVKKPAAPAVEHDHNHGATPTP